MRLGGADAHSQGGPLLLGAARGRAVGQCHLDMQPVDALEMDKKLPFLQPWPVNEGSSQGRPGHPVQCGVLPRTWGWKMKEMRTEVRQGEGLGQGREVEGGAGKEEGGG